LPYTIALGNLAIPKKYHSRVRLIGPITGVKPEQLPSKEEIRKKLGFDSNRYLIYAPVSGPRVERRYLADKLLEILSKPHADYQIVLSKGEPSSEAYPKKHGDVTVYDWIDDLTQFELLKACDLLVCRAGHGIVTKALTYGKPLVLIPIPDQTEQYGNANRAARLGVAEVIMQAELNEENLFKAAERILNSDIYERRARQVADMTATLDATRTAIEVVKQLASRSRQG
jgi:UDP:flavonoid glycosyltransferase YjiC (YdhE family)